MELFTGPFAASKSVHQTETDAWMVIATPEAALKQTVVVVGGERGRVVCTCRYLLFQPLGVTEGEL